MKINNSQFITYMKHLIPLFTIVLLFSCQSNTENHEGHDHHAHHHHGPAAAVPSNKPLPASTQAMVDELRAIAQDTTKENMWYLNARKAKKYEAQMAQLTQNPGGWISACFQAAFQWLNAGNYDRSIELMDQLFLYLTNNKVNLPPAQFKHLKELHAIAYMRKGEIENCLNNHNEYSCLMPIQGPGQHQNKSGSTSAIAIYEELLKADPNDMQNKWLYNLAHMTLGNYPDKVPADKRIDPAIFQSEANIERFVDVAMNLGVAVNDISGSVILDDFNNDNYLDIMVSSYGLQDQLYYFQNDGKGGFQNMTEVAGLKGIVSGLNIVQADYNNDGWMDVLVLRGAWMGQEGLHPNSLLKNEGDGTFRDVTREAGVYSRFPTQAASWADYNNDGWLDLFIGNESTKIVNAPSELYHNNGDGTFTEKAKELGLDVNAFIKGAVWGDINNDGWPDLYLSNLIGANKLMLNNGGKGFTDIAVPSGTVEPNSSFPCWFFDYNQDGLEDIFVSGFDIRQFETATGEVAKDYLGMPTQAEKPRLYRNNGNNTFTNVTKEARVDKVLYTMGCNVGDLNNDGYPDFYAATGTPDFRALIPNRMFLNDGGKLFKDVTTAGGFGHLQKGHGVAFGDMDADGDQDVYAVLGGSYSGDNFMNALFQNPGTKNHFVTLKLQGSTCNRPAIGALVKTIVDQGGTEKTYYQRVRSGSSFGANPLRIEQGIGAATTIKRVEVIWPGSTKAEIFEGLSPDGFYLLKQSTAKAELITRQKITFKR
jgi:tetratricopeptide (TPR) repeat protein